jgi:RND family efflux transporter MFP subunit
MSKNKKIIWLIIVTIVLAVIAFAVKTRLQTTGITSGISSTLVTSAKVAENIKATGPLEAQSEANLVWKTSGTVNVVHIKVGDRVSAGDVLLSIETTSAPANIIAAQADLVSANLALVNAQKSGLALAQAQQARAAALQAVDDAQEDVDKLNFRRASDDLINQTQDEIDLAKKAVSRAEDYFKLVKHRPEGDSIRAQAELTLIKARTWRDNRTALLNWYIGQPDAIDAAKYLSALAMAQAQLVDAEREIERLKDGPTAADIAAAQARVDAAQATVGLLSISATFDGEVLAIEQNPGDVVDGGMLAVSIADRSRLHIEAQVDETDIAGVAVGNPVSISMDAMPGTTLQGKVTFINPVGQNISGLIKYLVRVELEPVESPMLLGATADVEIQVSAAQDALLVPFNTVQSDKNGEFVMVIEKDGSTRQVIVQSGKAVGDLVIVKGDLKIGDQLQIK